MCLIVVCYFIIGALNVSQKVEESVFVHVESSNQLFLIDDVKKSCHKFVARGYLSDPKYIEFNWAYIFKFGLDTFSKKL